MIAVLHFSKAFSTRTQYNGRPCTEYTWDIDLRDYLYTEYTYYVIYSTEYGNVRY